MTSAVINKEGHRADSLGTEAGSCLPLGGTTHYYKHSCWGFPGGSVVRNLPANVLAIVNSAVMNNGIHVSFSILVSSGYMLRSGIAGSYGDFISSFYHLP